MGLFVLNSLRKQKGGSLLASVSAKKLNLMAISLKHKPMVLSWMESEMDTSYTCALWVSFRSYSFPPPHHFLPHCPPHHFHPQSFSHPSLYTLLICVAPFLCLFSQFICLPLLPNLLYCYFLNSQHIILFSTHLSISHLLCMSVCESLMPQNEYFQFWISLKMLQMFAPLEHSKDYEWLLSLG